MAAPVQDPVPSAATTDAAPNASAPTQGPSAPTADAAPSTPEAASAEILRTTLRVILEGKDLTLISLGECRRSLAQKLGFQPDAFEIRKKEIKNITRDLVRELLSKQPGCAKPPLEILLEEAEKAGALQDVYLITIARVLSAILADG